MVDWAEIVFPTAPSDRTVQASVTDRGAASAASSGTTGGRRPGNAGPALWPTSSRAMDGMLAACPNALPPTPWPEGVDYWLTRAAVTLAGLINTGGEVGFCLSGGIDAWDALGRYHGFSPSVVARMRKAELLPAKLAGYT